MNKHAVVFEEVTPHTMRANHKDYYDLNAGAIALDNFIIVVDPLMYPRHAKTFRTTIEKKYSLPVRYLFITHYHGDHVFGLAPFKDTEIFGSNFLQKNLKKRIREQWTEQAFEEWKEEEPESAELIDEIEVFLPSSGFDETRVIIDGNKRVEFYHSGGHTGCSSFAYFPMERVIFTGDELASGFWPFISDPTGSPEMWVEGYENMLALHAEFIVPGHGPLTDNSHIREHLAFLKTLIELVKESIEVGTELNADVIPDFYEPATEWQIPRALEFLTNFYSKADT